MKLRLIISESYEGLPDEDQFGLSCSICGAAGIVGHLIECAGHGCEQLICQECLFLGKGGWFFDQEEHSYSGLGARCPLHLQAYGRSIRSESYEGLPDEDEFFNEGPDWQGCHECGEATERMCRECFAPICLIHGIDDHDDDFDMICKDCAQGIIYDEFNPMTESYEGLPDEDAFEDASDPYVGISLHDAEGMDIEPGHPAFDFVMTRLGSIFRRADFDFFPPNEDIGEGPLFQWTFADPEEAWHAYQQVREMVDMSGDRHADSGRWSIDVGDERFFTGNFGTNVDHWIDNDGEEVFHVHLESLI